MCPSRGDETIIKSIMVLTSPLGACMLSARQTKQTDVTIRQTDHIASILAVSGDSCWLIFRVSSGLASSRFPTSCLFWASSHKVTVFKSFLWIVISFADSCSFLVLLSGSMGFSIGLLGTSSHSSVLCILVWL